MKIVRDAFLLGLVGLLAGCVTPADMGYVLPPEPVYTAPVSAAPVYNTSPAYYATPVSGYSTMTIYDGYHPGYGGPRYPHHRPPPYGRHPGMHGGHDRHGGHHGDRHGGGKSIAVPAGTHLNAGGHKRVPINQLRAFRDGACRLERAAAASGKVRRGLGGRPGRGCGGRYGPRRTPCRTWSSGRPCAPRP